MTKKLFSRQRSGGAPPLSPLMRRAFHRNCSSAKTSPMPADKPMARQPKEEQQPNEPKTPVVPVGRGRLDTEDTLRMNNLNLPSLLLDDDNPFLECHLQYTPDAVKRAVKQQSLAAAEETVDCPSTVSSLGDGSFKRPPATPASRQQEQQQQQMQAAGTPEQPFAPPKVISFRVEAEIPDWLLGTDDDDDDVPNTGSDSILENDDKDDLDKEGCDSIKQTNTATTLTDDDNTAENHLPLPPQMPYRPHRHYVEQHWNAQPMAPVDPFAPRASIMTPRTLGMLQPQPCMPPHVWTGVPSPANPRPTIGRHKSASCAALFPTRTTPQSTSTTTTTTKQVFPPPSPGGTLLSMNHSHSSHAPSFRHATPRRTTLVRTMTPTTTKSVTTKKGSKWHHQTQSPRQHRRNKSAGEASLLGGHDSLCWTAPTTASSLLEAPSLEPMPPSTAHAKRKSAVVQELRCMWGKMTRSDTTAAVAISKNSSSLEAYRLNSAHTGCFT